MNLMRNGSRTVGNVTTSSWPSNTAGISAVVASCAAGGVGGANTATAAGSRVASDVDRLRRLAPFLDDVDRLRRLAPFLDDV